MKRKKCVVKSGLSVALLAVAFVLSAPCDKAMADDGIQVTPLTAASADGAWSDSSSYRSRSVSWGPAGALLPEDQWKPYVTRPSAFIGSQTALDPARIPVLSKSGTRTSSGSRSSGARSSARSQAPKAAPVDPCAEKVRQALEEAAKAGKIPASAVPPKAEASPAGTTNVARSAANGAVTGAVAGATPGVAPSVANGQKGGQNSGQNSGQTTYPYDGKPQANNISPGTAAQGASAPSPELGTGAVAAPPTPFAPKS